MTSRNDVMVAVLGVVQNMTFAQPVQGASTWTTVTNRLKLWGDVPIDQRPYAALVSHQETDEYRGLGLVRRRLNLGVWCYTSSMNEPGGPQLDILMEAFEQAFLQPDNFSTNCNTLGGLVYWIRIEGRVFKDPGDLDNDTLLIVPLVVEMP